MLTIHASKYNLNLTHNTRIVSHNAAVLSETIRTIHIFDSKPVQLIARNEDKGQLNREGEGNPPAHSHRYSGQHAGRTAEQTGGKNSPQPQVQ